MSVSDSFLVLNCIATTTPVRDLSFCTSMHSTSFVLVEILFPDKLHVCVLPVYGSSARIVQAPAKKRGLTMEAYLGQSITVKHRAINFMTRLARASTTVRYTAFANRLMLQIHPTGNWRGDIVVFNNFAEDAFEFTNVTEADIRIIMSCLSNTLPLMFVYRSRSNADVFHLLFLFVRG